MRKATGVYTQAYTDDHPGLAIDSCLNEYVRQSHNPSEPDISHQSWEKLSGLFGGSDSQPGFRTVYAQSGDSFLPLTLERAFSARPGGYGGYGLTWRYSTDQFIWGLSDANVTQRFDSWDTEDNYNRYTGIMPYPSCDTIQKRPIKVENGLGELDILYAGLVEAEEDDWHIATGTPAWREWQNVRWDNREYTPRIAQLSQDSSGEWIYTDRNAVSRRYYSPSGQMLREVDLRSGASIEVEINTSSPTVLKWTHSDGSWMQLTHQELSDTSNEVTFQLSTGDEVVFLESSMPYDLLRTTTTSPIMNETYDFRINDASQSYNVTRTNGSAARREFGYNVEQVVRTCGASRYERHRVREVLDAGEVVTSVTWSDVCNLDNAAPTFTTSLGAVRSMTYDHLGRLVGTAMSTPDGRSSSEVYTYFTHWQNRIETETDTFGNVTRYEINDHGEVVKEIVKEGTAEEYEVTYEKLPLFNINKVIDSPRQRITRQFYNESSRPLITQESRLDKETGETFVTNISYSFHSTGLLKSIITDGPLSGSSDTSERHYDSRGRLIRTVDVAGFETLFGDFDGFQRARRIETSDGTVETLSYDILGRVVTRSRSNESGAFTESFEYYLNTSNTIKHSRFNGSELHSRYNDKGELIASKAVAANGEVLSVVGYQYDVMGNRTAEVGFDKSTTLDAAVSRLGSSISSMDVIVHTPAAPPEIISFSATPNYITKPQVVSVSWHVQNANTCELRRGSIYSNSVGSSGSADFFVDESSFITLHCPDPTGGEDIVDAIFIKLTRSGPGGPGNIDIR
ncbi:MAG: hypothetical protein ABNH02_01115 [Pseudomonadales bacterium]